MKKILFLLAGLFWGMTLSAQTWSKIYNDYAYYAGFRVVQCYDKGIAVATSGPNTIFTTDLIKTDADGNFLWSAVLKDSFALNTSLAPTSDGGFILGGGTNLASIKPWKPFIVKLNACGQKEWSHVFSSGVFVPAIVQLKDGGYIVDILNFGGDLICRLDSNGKPLWSLKFPYVNISSAGQDAFANILLEPDGNFLVTGTGNDTSTYHYFFNAKISPTGKVIWIYNYNYKQPGGTWGQVSCQAKDKGYLTLFSINDDSIGVLKQDSNGNEETLKQLGVDIGDAIGDMIYDSIDNSYIILQPAADTAGVSGQFYNIHDSVKLLKIDSSANILKAKTYPYQDVFGEIIPAYDNQFLIGGSIDLPGSSTGMHLWKINSSLEQDSFDTSHFFYDYKCNTKITDTFSLSGADTIKIDSATLTIVNTGIEQTGPLPDSKVSVYPNPTHNTFNIKLQGDNIQQSQVNLYDILGHSIASFSTNKNEFTINASDYSMKSGVYILTIRSGNAVLNAKLVVE